MGMVVIVQRDRAESLRYAKWLNRLGHSSVFCGGPQPPVYECRFERHGECVLWESGVLFVYHPWLDTGRNESNTDRLAQALRQHYPDKPLILVGKDTVVPTWVERLARRDSLVRAVFPATPRTLIAAATELLAAAPAGVASSG
jgi:hypothetical protein